MLDEIDLLVQVDRIEVSLCQRDHGPKVTCLYEREWIVNCLDYCNMRHAFGGIPNGLKQAKKQTMFIHTSDTLPVMTVK